MLSGSYGAKWAQKNQPFPHAREGLGKGSGLAWSAFPKPVIGIIGEKL